MSFKDLGLSDALVKAVHEKGYTVPSPIQQKAIPHILEGKDIIAGSATGSGKTIMFSYMTLEAINKKKNCCLTFLNWYRLKILNVKRFR